MDSSKFSWTQEFRRSWESTSKTHSAPTALPKSSSNNKKSIIRHLLVCIDTSAAIEKPDYVPTVRGVLSAALPPFVAHFKASNPLSSISFLTCRGVFERSLPEFNASVLLGSIGKEDFSLLNCLRAAVEALRTSTYNREVLLITASIGTRDSGEYEQVFSDIKKFNLRVSIISICGEVGLFKRVAEYSNGVFVVPLDCFHLEVVLGQFTEPQECLEPTSSLVRLGFPVLEQRLALCMCHLRLESGVYECPECRTYVCAVPVECPICGLRLVSPLDISRSLYFMYPLKPFVPVEGGQCRKCGREAKWRCGDCNSQVCLECERKMREELTFCIFCNISG